MNARHTDLSPVTSTTTATTAAAATTTATAATATTTATTAAAVEFVKKWRGEQHSTVRRDYLIQICHSPVSGGDSCLNLPPSSSSLPQFHFD